MVGDADYLGGLPPEQAEELARVNAPGLTALREYLDSGQAVAFLGAGVSAPLYPLWDGLIGELVEAAGPRLTEKEASTCRALARESPNPLATVERIVHAQKAAEKKDGGLSRLVRRVFLGGGGRS